MIEDQRCHPWLKDLSQDHTFVSKEMSSVGWTLMFDRDSYDSFSVKNR